MLLAFDLDSLAAIFRTCGMGNVASAVSKMQIFQNKLFAVKWLKEMNEKEIQKSSVRAVCS